MSQTIYVGASLSCIVIHIYHSSNQSWTKWRLVHMWERMKAKDPACVLSHVSTPCNRNTPILQNPRNIKCWIKEAIKHELKAQWDINWKHTTLVPKSETFSQIPTVLHSFLQSYRNFFNSILRIVLSHFHDTWIFHVDQFFYIVSSSGFFSTLLEVSHFGAS